VMVSIDHRFFMQSKPDKRYRRSLRLKGYDYTRVGAYFVTIVTERRNCLFGSIIDGAICLTSVGRIVQSVWNELPKHFSGIDTDVFVVMPNHVHGIICIADNPRVLVGAQHAAPSKHRVPSNPNVQPSSLGAIIRSFKSAVSKLYNEERGRSGLGIWQRNYYEHIIRDEKALISIREYIATNPARWSSDPENPARTKTGLKDNWQSDHNRISKTAQEERAQHAAPLRGIRKM
jgi:putative transposase